MIDEALKHGWAVFPCNGKLPATPHGFKDASKDPEVIKKLFPDGKKFNLGVETGKNSGIWVLDIDVKNGALGMESLLELEREHGQLPETVRAITQSKGYHYYFKYDARIGCRTGVRDGIDTRSDGGYVIAPPSDGYCWEAGCGPDDIPIVDAPEWIILLCMKQAAAGPRALTKEDSEIITKNRNSRLTAIAGKLRRVGMDADELLAMLRTINAKRCSPPLPEKEIVTIADSVGKYKVEINVQVGDPEDPGHVGRANISWENLNLPLNKNNVPICNVDCAVRVLDGLAAEIAQPGKGGINIWYDNFYQRCFTKKGNIVREWQDIDDLNLTMFMQRELGLTRISDDMVAKAVRIYAQANPQNEPLDWFEDLHRYKVWDGNVRLPKFFKDAFGVDESAYSQQAAVNFWISMVARIYRPGCKVDTMVVLEGVQGLGKTMALHAIGGDWHTESNEPITSKDFFQCLPGKMIVEIAELDSFNKVEVTRVKQVISCRTDRYRESYGRRASDHPRMCVFVGTTNQSEYLRDETGGRRFWPIHCKRIDLAYIEKNRTQLFAEAVERFKQGEDWYKMPHAETMEQQESRRHADDWEEAIRQFIQFKTQVTSLEVATECLKIEIGRNDRMIQMRVAKVLRSLNWKSEIQKRGCVRYRVWVSAENLISHVD